MKKDDLILDTSMIDAIGMKRFYSLYKRIFVYECKQAGLSQNQTLIKLNHDLKTQGQKPVSLSQIKNLW
jgi:hypothetical protein